MAGIYRVLFLLALLSALVVAGGKKGRRYGGDTKGHDDTGHHEDDSPPRPPPHDSPGFNDTLPLNPPPRHPGARDRGPEVDHTMSPFRRPGRVLPVDEGIVDEPTDRETLNARRSVSTVKVVAFVTLGLLLLVSMLTLTFCLFKKVYHRHLKRTAPDGPKDRVVKVKVIDRVSKPRQPRKINVMREFGTVLFQSEPQNVRFTRESGMAPPPWKPRNIMFTGDTDESPLPWTPSNVKYTRETDISSRPVTPKEAPELERSRSNLIVSPPPPYSPLPDVEQRPEARIRVRSPLFRERNERWSPDGLVLQVSPPPAYDEIIQTDI